MASFQGIELKMMNFTINPQNENRYNNITVSYTHLRAHETS